VWRERESIQVKHRKFYVYGWCAVPHSDFSELENKLMCLPEYGLCVWGERERERERESMRKRRDLVIWARKAFFSSFFLLENGLHHHLWAAHVAYYGHVWESSKV
jgi:hypothetical protein